LGCFVEPALAGPDVGEVGNPILVRPFDLELPVQMLAGTNFRCRRKQTPLRRSPLARQEIKNIWRYRETALQAGKAGLSHIAPT